MPSTILLLLIPLIPLFSFLLNFLQFQFPAADDCAPSTKLGVNITYERGSCHDTVYTLTPFQDYPECND